MCVWGGGGRHSCNMFLLEQNFIFSVSICQDRKEMIGSHFQTKYVFSTDAEL